MFTLTAPLHLYYQKPHSLSNVYPPSAPSLTISTFPVSSHHFVHIPVTEMCLLFINWAMNSTVYFCMVTLLVPCPLTLTGHFPLASSFSLEISLTFQGIWFPPLLYNSHSTHMHMCARTHKHTTSMSCIWVEINFLAILIACLLKKTFSKLSPSAPSPSSSFQ